jgi:hypothetical protein
LETVAIVTLCFRRRCLPPPLPLMAANVIGDVVAAETAEAATMKRLDISPG